MSPLYTTRQDLIPAAVGGGAWPRALAESRASKVAPEHLSPRRGAQRGPVLPIHAYLRVHMASERRQTVKSLSSSGSKRCSCPLASRHGVALPRVLGLVVVRAPIVFTAARLRQIVLVSVCMPCVPDGEMGLLAPHGASGPRPSRFWAARASWCQWPSSLTVLGCSHGAGGPRPSRFWVARASRCV